MVHGFSSLEWFVSNLKIHLIGDALPPVKMIMMPKTILSDAIVSSELFLSSP